MVSLMKLINPSDFFIFSLLFILNKPLLRGLHSCTLRLRKKFNSVPIITTYEESLFGFIEYPIMIGLLFLPFVYMLDMTNIILHAIGFEFKDLSRLSCVVYEAVTAGLFITKLKDFVFNLRRIKKYNESVLLQKKNTDENIQCSSVSPRRDSMREGENLFPVHTNILFQLLKSI